MLKNFRFKYSHISFSDCLKISIVLCWLLWAIFFSLTASINIPTFHLDGAFQTASGLYRLDAGQFPGKDFFPYLGIGPIIVLYPFFKIFGSNISASVFSSQFVTIIFHLISVAFIWHLIFQPRLLINSLVAGCLLYLLPLAICNLLTINLPKYIYSGGNSLRSIRSFAPYLIFIIYYFFVLPIKKDQYKYFLSGLLSGLILLWSNDFAIPTACLFTIFILTDSIFFLKHKFFNAFIYLVTTLLSWTFLLTIATHGHPIELLHYNFLDVAHDQWWFFGLYDLSSRIFNFQDFLLHAAEILFPVFILLFTFILAVKKKLIEYKLLFWIGLILFAGGLLASIGGHFGGYFFGSYLWGILVICIGLARLVWIKLSYYLSQAIKPAVAIFFCVSIFFSFVSISLYFSANYNAAQDHNRFYVSELGGYLNSEWKNYIYLARNTSEPAIFEEYWGLWSATRKIFPNWQVDSVIHALGQKRIEAGSALKNAKLIITTNEFAYPDWVGWNISENYWFYQDLLREWTPVAKSPLTTVWQKSKQNLSSLKVPCQIDAKDTIKILVNQLGLLEVGIQYQVSGFRSLLLVDNNFSFSPVTNGFVSLDPKANNALIPMYASNKGVNIYKARFLPANRNLESKLIACTAKLLSGDIVYGKTMIIATPANNLSDINWQKGIGKNCAGFFVLNTPNNINLYKVGRKIKNIAGEVRTIKNVIVGKNFIHINLWGKILDGDMEVFPDRVEVLE